MLNREIKMPQYSKIVPKNRESKMPQYSKVVPKNCEIKMLWKWKRIQEKKTWLFLVKTKVMHRNKQKSISDGKDK